MNDEQMQETPEFLYGISKEEIDEPIPEMEASNSSDSLEVEKLRAGEKEKERKEKRYFTAFKLIVGCLMMLGVIYLVDTIVSVIVTKEASSITSSVVEVVKTLLFTLSGYLFARKENGD